MSDVLHPKAVWVTWENQRRNAGIAGGLGVPLYVLDLKYSRVKRYALALWRTLTIFRTERPAIVFVQNPSLVLALAAVVYGKLSRTIVVVDAHNAALIPLSGGGLHRLLARLAVRLAFMTIVTNDSLAAMVVSSGGRPFVLPDRIPTLPIPMRMPEDDGRRRVLFICTFAADEPYLEVMEAARRLIGTNVVVFITGNPKARAQALREAAPANVVFTGFLPEEDYVAAVRSADVIIDLTTREDCLVCGAYEGIAAERPLILSGTAATRAYFSRGVRYTDNSAADIAQAIRDVLASQKELEAEARQLKTRLTADWQQRVGQLVSVLNTTAGMSRVAS